MKSDLKDINLAPFGKLKIEWAGSQMKVLEKIKDRFRKEKPLKGIHLGACLHVTAETANLIIALKEGGAEVALCGSNPLSTQDDVAASIFKDYDVPTFAVRGEDNKRYYEHLNAVLDTRPEVTTDDGADLVTLLHTKRKDQLKELIGSSEETTTGLIRLKAMYDSGELKIPVMAVNDSKTKHMFDNRYGTGQSTVDGILRATNILLAGKKFVVCGYGWCGRGLASRARGMGADVIITEIDPVKALEAVMDGYEVMPLKKALEVTDIIVTATGNKHVLGKEHFEIIKEGAIIANTGHFNVEFDYDGLIKTAKKRRTLRPNLEEITLPQGKVIYALGEGRLINLVAAEGHPPDVMDMSFANQALAAEFFVKNKGSLEPKIYTIPEQMDSEIARIKLETLGIGIDFLTRDQKKYLESWTEGT
jgi:adenosylhomocysteinase